MKKISLTEKLILYFLTIGIFTIVSTSWYAYQSGRRALINRTFDQLTSVRVVKQNLVENYFSDRFHELHQYANAEGIEKMVQAINNQHLSLDSLSMLNLVISDRYLIESFLENNNILSIYVSFNNITYKIDKAHGKIFLREISNFLLQDYQSSNQNKNTYLIHEIRKKQPDHFSLLLGKTVFLKDQKTIIGIEISLSPINQIMIENDPNTGWGKSGESYVVGDDHLMKTPSRFISQSVQKTEVYTTAVTEGLAGKQGTSILKDYRNIDVLSSYSKLNISDLNWVILAEIDLNEAMAPVNSLRNEILFLSIFITSIVFLLAFLLARSITRPVRKLTNAAERIQEGDYNVEVKVTHDDEIGSLTRAFNAMANRIRQQSRARIDGQDMERQRLSRELHDGLGQWMVAARFRLESTDCLRPEVNRQQIAEIKKMMDNIIEEIRRISNNLMPGVLQEFGLESALHAIARETGNAGKLSVKLNINTPLEGFTADYQLYLFRIIQEAVNNILKHAKATEASIDIHQTNNSIILIIQDDGKGFNLQQDNLFQGNGLFNMRERTHLLGGEMILKSRPGGGTSLYFNLPLTQPN